MTIVQTISRYEAIHKYSFSKQEIADQCDISTQALNNEIDVEW